MSNGWNKDLLDAIDACIVAAGGTPGARVAHWNQDVLLALSELATVIGGGSGTPPASSDKAVAVTRSGASGAGSTSSTTVLTGRVNRVRVEVLAAFDAGATARVGFSDSTSALLAVSDIDATFLATLNAVREYTVDVAVSGTGVLRVESVGSSTTGSLKVTAFYATPGA